MLNKKLNKGITLIALIITIVVMLLLVAVTLSIALGENGAITNAKEAKQLQEKAVIREKIELEVAACYDYESESPKVKMAELIGNLGTVFANEIANGDVDITGVSNESESVIYLNRINETQDTNFPTADIVEVENFLNRYEELENWAYNNREGLTNDLVKEKMAELGMYEYYPENSMPEVTYGGILDLNILNLMNDILNESIIWVRYKQDSFKIDLQGNVEDTSDSSGFDFATDMVTDRNGTSVNSIVGYTGNCPSKIIINDSNIKLIKAGAYRNCLNLKELVIENSSIEIQDGAFENCKNLETVTVNFAEIATGGFSCTEAAFSGCDKLSKIIVTGITETYANSIGMTKEAIGGVFGADVEFAEQ